MTFAKKCRFAFTFPVHTARSVAYAVRSRTFANGSPIVTRYGVALNSVDPIVSPLIRQKIVAGRYEFVEAAIASKLINPGDVVLELGAGLGFLSTYISKLVGAKGKVFTYEADSATSGAARDTIRRNQATNVEVVASAVVPGDVAEQRLSQERDFWIRSMLPGQDGGSIEGSTTVRTTRFGALLNAHVPDVLVMDVEGLEYSLFTQQELPRSLRSVIVEIHAERLTSSQQRECIRVLNAQDYVVTCNFGREFGFSRR